MTDRSSASGSGRDPHDHTVTLYGDDDELLAAAVTHLAPAFAGDGAVLVVATPEHRGEIERRCTVAGVDLAGHRAAGTYRALDARALLDLFLSQGRPDPVQFRSVVGDLMAEMARRDGPVRIFGEMVALLWDLGDVAGALTLESWWNDLADEHVFSLFCGYPIRSMEEAALLGPVATMCREHSNVHTPIDYLDPPNAVVDGSVDLVSRFFVPVPLAARAARRLVRETLAAWGGDDVSPDAELIASELAGNAVLHARSPFRLSLRRVDRGMKISVQDADPSGAPAAAVFDPEATGGRGMSIIASLARDWGVERGDDGKTVWVDLDLPRAG